MRTKQAKSILEDRLNRETRVLTTERLAGRLKLLRESSDPPMSQQDLFEAINREGRVLLRDAGHEVPSDYELFSKDAVRRHEGSGGLNRASAVYADLFERALGLLPGDILGDGDSHSASDIERAEELADALIKRRSHADGRFLRQTLGRELSDSAVGLVMQMYSGTQERVGFPGALATLLWAGGALDQQDVIRSHTAAKYRQNLFKQCCRSFEDLDDREVGRVLVALLQVAEVLLDDEKARAVTSEMVDGSGSFSSLLVDDDEEDSHVTA